ncbi:phosphonate metabolism protein PhnP [Ignatzschineria rhizosphaerae]|uniref:Phosphonate metabolism protein PhnP n=1 Tax=Ignatzschineria rhizosphaerae TaxID=2923279 RepID=A0ABY3WXZ1_9GAMM|nr:phosphonate metabolism protein PhnP [Ignatzschineria rhizosphaerae]UNM94940.1 phosphonate metabolism protein PhnP [Ignatzschineria rhizosphaerae]
MFELILLGTGDVAEIPVFGCDCAVCLAARNDLYLERKPCSAMIRYQDQILLIDAGLTDLHRRFSRDEIKGILQTHYHADHAQGLLALRWGKSQQIPIYGPDDPLGFADLYKNPGILDFQKPWRHGEQREIIGLAITALKLNHSKLTMGYFIEGNHHKIAYLTDTVGLPKETIDFLQNHEIDNLIIDCNFPPQIITPRNHNDINTLIETTKKLNCNQVVLTHIGHELEAWLQNPRHQAILPNNYVISYDGMCFSFNK